MDSQGLYNYDWLNESNIKPPPSLSDFMQQYDFYRQKFNEVGSRIFMNLVKQYMMELYYLQLAYLESTSPAPYPQWWPNQYMPRRGYPISLAPYGVPGHFYPSYPGYGGHMDPQYVPKPFPP